MNKIYEVGMEERIKYLPDISKLDIDTDFKNRKDSLFLSALGFEERCAHLSLNIAKSEKYEVDSALIFEYSTNMEENSVNRGKLIGAISKFSRNIVTFNCDSEEFAYNFRNVIKTSCKDGKIPSITFDISVCSTKLILTVLNILLEFDVKLRIIYTEAQLYHPKKQDAERQKEALINGKRLGITEGVTRVFSSREYSGSNTDQSSEMIIAFATFKPERTKSIISFIDENLVDKPGKRVLWIIGTPHLKENKWREKLLREINQIDEEHTSVEVSTFYYKDTIKELDKIYLQNSEKYHLNLSPLGSKMQAIGIALFHYVRPDVSVIFAQPERYDAINYSGGFSDIWKIDFDNIDRIKKHLDTVGLFKIRKIP